MLIAVTGCCWICCSCRLQEMNLLVTGMDSGAGHRLNHQLDCPIQSSIQRQSIQQGHQHQQLPSYCCIQTQKTTNQRVYLPQGIYQPRHKTRHQPQEDHHLAEGISFRQNQRHLPASDCQLAAELVHILQASFEKVPRELVFQRGTHTIQLTQTHHSMQYTGTQHQTPWIHSFYTAEYLLKHRRDLFQHQQIPRRLKKTLQPSFFEIFQLGCFLVISIAQLKNFNSI